MPAMIGGSRGYPTENQPLSYAQQYGAGIAAAPPTNLYSGGFTPTTTGTTPSATIGGAPAPAFAGAYGAQLGQPQAGVQSAYQAPSAQPGQTGAYGPNIIGNNLPWNLNASGNMMNALSADPATTIANIGPAYKSAYDDYLKFSMDQTNNITAGYGQTAQNQFLGQQATQAGYGNLSRDVLAGISGIGSDQQALLARQFQQQRGTAMQGLINSGLGNSTVTSSVNRGIGLDEGLAGNNLANAIAQTKAGYQSQIGQAGLNYQGQSVRDNTNLSLDQLHWMNSITAKAPDASLYGNIAQQAGAAIQSNANRAQIDRLASQNSDLGAQVRQAAVLGGSGGTQPGTGGRLPLSSINYGAGASSPGAGGGASFGSDFFTAPGTRAPGTGGGGAMSAANAPRGGSSGGFGSGLSGAAGVTNYMGGNAGAAAAGFPSVIGAGLTAADQFNQQFNQQRAALGLPPVGVGQESSTVASDFAQGGAGGATGGGGYYDPYQNPFGFGGEFTVDWGNTEPGYNPNDFMPTSYSDPGQAAYDFGAGAFGSAFPSYDYSGAAQDFGAGAFGGLSDYWGDY